MAERLLSVRGVKVPPGWVLRAIKMTSEIIRRRVSRDFYAVKGEAYGVEGVWLAEKSACGGMSICRQQGLCRQPNHRRQLRLRCPSIQAARHQ